jgi:hypothetical protein
VDTPSRLGDGMVAEVHGPAVQVVVDVGGERSDSEEGESEERAGHAGWLVVRDDLDSTVVVTVAVMGVMEVAVYEVVGVVAMGDGFVAALGAVGVAGAAGIRGASHWIGEGYRDGGLIYVIAVGGVEVAVVEVGDFVADEDGGMATTFSVDVRVAAVDGVVGAHMWTS